MQSGSFGDGALSQFDFSQDVYDLADPNNLAIQGNVFYDGAGPAQASHLEQMDLGFLEFGSPAFGNDMSTINSNQSPSEQYSHARSLSNGDDDMATTEPFVTQLDTQATFLGVSGEMDPYFLQFYQYDHEGKRQFKELTVRSVSEGATPVNFLVSSSSLMRKSHTVSTEDQALNASLKDDLCAVMPLETGRRLLHLYNRFMAPLYPIFAELERPTVEDSVAHLLAAVYISVQPFVNFDEKLCIDLAYEPPAQSALMDIAYRGLENATRAPDLSLVQTLILLVLQPFPNPVVSDAPYKWSLFGKLVAAAQTTGLQMDPKGWTIPEWQITLRRRLSFTIYATDKWLAASLGRPPMIHPENWLVTCLSTEDAIGADLSPASWSQHLQYSALCTVLGDVLFGMYSLRAINDAGTNDRDMLDKARPLLTRLLAWQRENVVTTERASENRALSKMCDLGHHYIKILIFRAVSRSLLNEPPMSRSDLTMDERREARHFSRSGMKGATAGAAEFVNGLSQEDGDMFWPHWTQSAFATVCFALLTMGLSSTQTEEATRWFCDLADVRRKMRPRSRAMPVLRLGLLRIDSIFWFGPKKVLKMNNAVQQGFDAAFGSDGNAG